MLQPTLERQTVAKAEAAEVPEMGEGSEYGRKRREEARRRRRGYRLRTKDPDDQPWVLSENKKGGKQLSVKIEYMLMSFSGTYHYIKNLP